MRFLCFKHLVLNMYKCTRYLRGINLLYVKLADWLKLCSLYFQPSLSGDKQENQPVWCFKRRLNVWHSLFQNEDHLTGHLVDFVEIDNTWTGRCQLQYGDLMNDLGPAVLTLPPLPHVLCCELFTRAFLHTLPHHSKLASERERKRMFVSRL